MVTPRAIQVVVSLGVTPFIVRRVGLSGFGLWSVVQTLVAFLSLADFGFPTTAMRLVARARARGRVDEMHTAINITMALMLAVAVATLLCAWLVALLIGDVGLGHLPHGAPWLLRWTGIGLSLTYVSKGFAVVPQGLNRWDIQTTNQLAGQFVSAAAVVIALLLGAGLAALGLSFALAGATVAILGYGQARRLIALRWGFRYLDRDTFRGVRRQGANLFVVNLVEATSLQADKFMLLPVASLRFIGLYAIGSRVAVMIRLFAISILGPLSTRVAAIEGRSGMDGVRAYYPPVLRKTVMACAVPMVVVAFAGYPAVLAWLGTGFTVSAAVGTLLGLGFAVNMVTGAGTATAAACGRADLDRKYSLINLTINIGATIVLAVIVGRWGVLGGTLLGLVGSSWILVRDVDRWLGVPGFVVAFDRRTRQAVAFCVAVGALGLGLAVALPHPTRLTDFLLACGTGTAMVAAACVGGGVRWHDVRAFRLRV